MERRVELADSWTPMASEGMSGGWCRLEWLVGLDVGGRFGEAAAEWHGTLDRCLALR